MMENLTSKENVLDNTFKAKKYWINLLKDSESKTMFPYVFEPEKDQKNEYGSTTILFNEETSERILHIANGSDNRLFMILLSTLSMQLKYYGQGNDVKIGIPIYDQGEQYDQFVNTLLTIRTQIDENSTFKSTLLGLKEQLNNSSELQNYAFENVIYNLGYSFESKVIPFFDVMCLLDGLHNESYIKKYNSNVIFKAKNTNKLEVEIKYNIHLYSAEFMANVAENYTYLLEKLVFSPDLPLKEIEYLSEKERVTLSQINSGINTGFDEGHFMHGIYDAFEKKADNIAITDKSGNQITYRELGIEVNNLVFELKSKYGVEKGDRIGVLIKDSSEWAISLLGIMAAGCTYVPINPAFPEERRAYIIKDSGVKFLITKEPFHTPLHTIQIKLRSKKENKFPLIDLSENEIAYLIYTSGSTGNPKGIKMPVKGMNNLLNWQKQKTALGTERKTLQFASISFDVSLQEVLYTFLTGGELFLINDALRQDISLLEKHIVKNDIEVLFFPYSVLNAIFKFGNKLTDAKSIKHIVTAGEALVVKDDFALFIKNNPKIQIHNQYGPSETHVVTNFSFSGENYNNDYFPPIGKPIANTKIHILDENLKAVPAGVPGEICVSGSQLAEGYLTESQTELKFINLGESGEKIYKTGDIAKWRSDGNITFIKRIDDQVKIRGFRVELEEVRKHILASKKIANCVVLAKKTYSKEYNELCAYLTLKDAESIELQLSETRTFLEQCLPYFMVPSEFIVIHEFPVTVNGKVDKKALLKMDSLVQKKVIPPNTKTEKVLVDIWKDVLNKTEISITDKIVEIGGNSISIVIIAAKIKEMFHFEISMKDIFDLSTITEIAERLESKEEKKSLLVNLAGDKSQRNAFFIPPIIGTSFFFQKLALELQNDLNCYGLQYRGFDFDESFDSSIEKMAISFLEEMQAVNENQEILIIGFSMGAIVAFEMAKQLENQKVNFKLVLVDKNLNVNYEEEEEAFDQDFIGVTKDLSIEKGVKNRIQKLYKHNFKILADYKIEGTIETDIYALEAQDNIYPTNMKQWEILTKGDFKLNFIDGSHYTILEAENQGKLIQFFKEI